MDDVSLLIELHKANHHLGPGSESTTLRALELSGLMERSGLQVADLGCGTGASALVLAEKLDGHITAIDLFPEFLHELSRRAEARGVTARLTTMEASLDALKFELGSLDAIWSEGAIYNLGFEAGLTAWRPFLKVGGVLALTEITWLTFERPGKLQNHWEREYPEIDLASAKLAKLERNGFTPIGYFPLPESCWLQNYYAPLRARFPEFLKQHGDSEAARACVAAEEREMELYDRYKAHVGYGFYIARKTDV